MKKTIYMLTCFVLILAVIIACPNCNHKTYADEEIFAGFSSSSYALIDSNSDTVLHSFNGNQKMPVASICKLMTTLLTLEQIESEKLNLDDKLVASSFSAAAEGSQAFLDAGSEYLVRDLLKSVIVASANDSAIVLAECIGGSEDNFVKLMNKRAKELGMNNTLYANSTGLPAANQYSTALDSALIIKELNKYDLYKDDCKIWMDKIIHPSGRETELVNTNRLVKYYDKCLSGKTGFTDEAGYCLVSTASDDKMDLIAVTLNCESASSRFKESMQLFNYGFNNFENKKVVDKNNVIDDIKVNGGKETSVTLIPQNDFYLVSKKGEENEIDTRFETPEFVDAPIDAGECVGKIIVLQNGIVKGEVEIVTVNKIEKQNFKDIINKIIDNWKL